MTRRWKAKAFVGVSLDGFIARDTGDIAWFTGLPDSDGRVTVRSDHPAEVWETFFPQIDVLVMGRRTYETVAEFDEWPYPDLPIIVVSRTAHPEDSRIPVAHALDEAISALDSLDSRDVYGMGV